MGKKGKKKAVTVEWLEDAASLKLGKKLTVEKVFTDYVLPELKSKKRRASTVTSLEREVGRFQEWWRSIAADEPLPICKIRRRHLQAFREWLADRGHSVPLQNGSVRAILQVLHSAEKHELITHSPKLESLSHRGVAPKVFPSDEEIDAIWQACEQATWPRRDSRLQPLGYSPVTAWRAAIVMYRTYGFRTQELIQLEQGFRSLTWKNIVEPGLTPNPVGRCECEFGWLSYVPQKQERVKADPLVVPLNKYTQAAIGLVRPAEQTADGKIFDWAMSAISFRKQWTRLCDLAKVKPRETSGVHHYMIKHLRKAATTQINNHAPGLAEHVVGHGGDRSGQGNQTSLVSGKHYHNPEQAVLACVLSMPVPSCFKELINVADN